MYAQECKKIPIKTTVENAEYAQCRDDQLLVVDGGEGVVEQKEEVVETVKCSVEIIMKQCTRVPLWVKMDFAGAHENLKKTRVEACKRPVLFG